MKKSWMIGSVLVSALAFAAPAAAAEQPEAGADEATVEDTVERSADASATNRGVITLPWIDIVGRPDRPQAAVAISRMATRLTLVDLKQMFLERIEQTILSGSF